MRNILTYSKIIPPKLKKWIDTFAMRYSAARLVPCGGALFIFTNHG